jgi:hypothetical protein
MHSHTLCSCGSTLQILRLRYRHNAQATSTQRFLGLPHQSLATLHSSASTAPEDLKHTLTVPWKQDEEGGEGGLSRGRQRKGCRWQSLLRL